MVPFLKQYFKAQAVIIGCMLSYWLILVPWVQPVGTADYDLPSFAGISSGNRWWEQLFSGQDWEVGQPTVVHSSRGVLLAKTWEQVDQKTWKLTPLTIVMTQTDVDELVEDPHSPASEVWVIRAQDGATIHFDQPLDLNSGTVPGIQRGHLEGRIEISKVSLDMPSDVKVALSTSNLSIDRRQIWTEDEVQLQTQDLLVQGRVLKISLTGDILSQRDPKEEELGSLSNGPVEEIELMHLSKMEMQLEPGGIWRDISPNLLQTDQPVSELPATLRAHCGGRFTLNLSRQIATLSNGVHLWHTLGSLPPDEFHCHRVQIRFQSDAFDPNNADPNNALPQPGNSNGGEDNSSSENTPQLLARLNVREIEAYGIDSLENLVGEMWVELKSPTMNASAKAKRIRYDVTRQRFELAGRLNHPKSTVSVAELNFQGHHLRAPLLEYQAPPRGDDEQRKHAGWMLAQGPGELSTPPQSMVGEFHVRWQEHLHWVPAQDKPGQRIEVSGKTFVESKRWGFVTAESLELWLKEEGIPLVATESTTGGAGFQPERLIASGAPQVQMGNSKMSVESIDIHFVYPQMEAPRDPGMTESADSLALQDATGNPAFQFLNQPDADELSTNPDRLTDPLNTPAVELVGTDLRAAVVSANGQYWIDSMTLDGPLSMRTLSTQDAIPLEVVGNAMVMATSVQGEVDLEIQGDPAKILFADGSIQGPSVRFNQRENHLWIDHPGECVLPSSALGSLTQGQPMTWEMPIRCRWEGRMMFNGKLVRCDGGIRINGASRQFGDLWIMESFCDYLDLELEEAVDFRRLESPKSGTKNGHSISVSAVMPRPGGELPPRMAEVSQISLQDNVDIRIARRDVRGQRISLQRLQVPTVTIYVPQKKIVAKGPGHGLSKFIGGPKNRGQGNAQTEPSPAIQCAHILFRDNLVAFLESNEVVVEGNVRVLSSPISSWEAGFDPYSLNGLSMGQMSLSCDQLKLVDTQSLSTSQSSITAVTTADDKNAIWEMQATGNVVFEGSVESGNYAGNAYQLTYVQAKNLLTFRGDGRSKALLQRKPPPGVESSFPTVIQVPIATLDLKTMGVEVPQGGLDVRIDTQPDSPKANTPSTTASPASPPNPRDGLKNFLRGY